MLYHSINKILVPVDFTELSRDALHAAATLSAKLKAELILLHVIENYFLLSTPETGIPADLNLTDMQSMSKKNLEDLSNEFRKKYQIDVRVLSDFGLASSRIVRTAIREEAGLIVMGTHGASGIREFFIGSNAYSVVKQASVPVLTIPSGTRKLPFKKVLFPIRLIPNALDKYETARQFFSGDSTKLEILGLHDGKDENRDLLNKLVDVLRERILSDGIALQTDLRVTNNIPSEVLKTSEQGEFDLIVISSTLDHTFKEFFVGPYTQQIVNHSKVPVLSIKPVPDPGQMNTMRSQVESQERDNPSLAIGFG